MKKHNLKKRGLLGIGLLAALQATPSMVSAEVSANVSAASNYLFRGVTQTDGATAIQGGLDYEHASGFYAGGWGSNVDFGDGTSYELDLYAGYSGAVDDIGYDVGYVYYAYPDAPDSIDFGEIYGELSYGIAALGFAYTANSDASGEGLFVEGDIYYYLSASVPLQNDYSAGVTVGYYDFTDEPPTVTLRSTLPRTPGISDRSASILNMRISTKAMHSAPSIRTTPDFGSVGARASKSASQKPSQVNDPNDPSLGLGSIHLAKYKVDRIRTQFKAWAEMAQNHHRTPATKLEDSESSPSPSRRSLVSPKKRV